MYWLWKNQMPNCRYLVSAGTFYWSDIAKFAITTKERLENGSIADDISYTVEESTPAANAPLKPFIKTSKANIDLDFHPLFSPAVTLIAQIKSTQSTFVPTTPAKI